MRKLILEEWVSLDGYAADAKGELDFFPDPGTDSWSDHDQLKFLESIDTIVLGRKTYEMFVAFWPTDQSKNEVIANRLNEIPKIVFSGKLQSAPWGNWPQAQILSGNLTDKIKELIGQQGKNIVMWGSLSIAQELIENDLVDEIRLHVCPVATGGGRLLFPEFNGYKNFELIDVKRYDDGVIFLHYRFKKSLSPS